LSRKSLMSLLLYGNVLFKVILYRFQELLAEKLLFCQQLETQHSNFHLYSYDAILEWE
jgi:hypothetical protein